MDGCLAPEKSSLSTIFGAIKPSSIQILSNNPTTCTFRAQFEVTRHPTLPDDLIVRLETSSGNLSVVTALQSVAALAIPELVPKTYVTGAAVTAHGKVIKYTVTQYVPDTVVLESVWPELSGDQKTRLMSTVVNAVGRLQKLRFEDERIQLLLKDTPFCSNSSQYALGGPRAGYSTDIFEYLTNFIASQRIRNNTLSTIEKTSDGVCVHSAQSPNRDITFTQQELVTIFAITALSQNDLEPRNILVKRVPSGDSKSKPRYKLAAIIDWEMAGFMPFTFEYAWKDASLGGSNLYSDWYTLFKSNTRDFVPAVEGPKMLEAIHLVTENKEQAMASRNNVSAELRNQWIARESAVWAANEGGSVMDGWMVKNPTKYSQEANDKLVTQILKDFGCI